MQRQRKKSQEAIVQFGDRVLVPIQWIHIKISLSCSAGTDTPNKWRKLTVCCPQTSRPPLGWNQKVDDVDPHFPHHQPIGKTSTLLIIPSLDHYYKTPHYLPSWDTQFWDISPLWPPLCPYKAKQFFFLLHPKLYLWDLIQRQCIEARFIMKAYFVRVYLKISVCLWYFFIKNLHTWTGDNHLCHSCRMAITWHSICNKLQTLSKYLLAGVVIKYLYRFYKILFYYKV